MPATRNPEQARTLRPRTLGCNTTPDYFFLFSLFSGSRFGAEGTAQLVTPSSSPGSRDQSPDRSRDRRMAGQVHGSPPTGGGVERLAGPREIEKGGSSGVEGGGEFVGEGTGGR